MPVHVLFSEMPLPRSVDPDELKRLNEFRVMLRDQGLLGSYASIEDLTAKVRTALDHDLGSIVDTRQEQVVGSQSRDTALSSHAILRITYFREGASRDILSLENLGFAAAEDISLDLEGFGEGEVPDLLIDGPIKRLPPSASVRIPLVLTFGTTSQLLVTIRWLEGTATFEEVQSVTLF